MKYVDAAITSLLRSDAALPANSAKNSILIYMKRPKLVWYHSVKVWRIFYRLSQKSLQYKRYNRFILCIHVHKSAQQTGVSYGSRRTVPKKYLHLIPYNVTSVLGLKEMHEKRVE
jgi:hypothetical protein